MTHTPKPIDLDHLERHYDAVVARENARLDLARDRFAHIADEARAHLSVRHAVARDQAFLRRLHRQRFEPDR